MTGFHFTGTAVPVLPESWFPFHRIPGSLGLEYSYYVDTAGKNAKKIEEYIRHQLDEDKAGEQLTMGNF